MRAFAHLVINFIADLFLELYDTALDVTEWGRTRARTLLDAHIDSLPPIQRPHAPWLTKSPPAWDELEVPEPSVRLLVG